MAGYESPMSCLDIVNTITAGQTATISNELSAAEVVGMVVYGAAGVTATLKKNGNVVAVATYTTNEGNACTLTSSQASIIPADVLTIEVTVANASRVVVHTRFPNASAFALTVNVA